MHMKESLQNQEAFNKWEEENEKTKEEAFADFERKERQRHGGSGKMRNPMKHLTPKKKPRK